MQNLQDRPVAQEIPEGVSTVLYGQVGFLMANTALQLFILWAAIDAYGREEINLVVGLAIANLTLFLISLGVLWLGRNLDEKTKR